MSVAAALVIWPIVASLVLVVGARTRTVRRRVAFNRALHELRRPLQALALAPGSGFRRGSHSAPGSLELALAALDDLDALVNGARPVLARRPVAAREFVESARERWRHLAQRRGRKIALQWAAGTAVLMADPARVAQALDNLLANAIEHGDGDVLVAVRRSPVGLRIEVASRSRRPGTGTTDPRRGHGLAVVERVATSHLGRFRLIRADGRIRAVFELPLAPSPVPAVPIEWARSARAARPSGGAFPSVA